MKLISGLLVGMGAASAMEFPQFDHFHPHCEMTTIYNRRCLLAYEDIRAYIQKGVDPFNKDHQNQFYTAKKPDFIWAARKDLSDGEGVYKTDDVIWEFKSIKVDGERKCEIHSRSAARDVGYDDKGRNFCNMYNAFRAQQFTHEEPQLTNCAFHPRVMYAHDVWKHCGHDAYYKSI